MASVKLKTSDFSLLDNSYLSLAFSSLNCFVNMSDKFLFAVSILFDVSSVTVFTLAANLVFSN
jgi:hypothetical protein